MGGVLTFVVACKQGDVLRWMMHLFGKGVGLGGGGVIDVRCCLQTRGMFFR